MAFVFAAPEALASAASDLAGIGSTLGTASATVAAPTTGVLAAAADEVSAQVAALFSGHGLGYQQLSARLAAFHEQFVQTLSAGASAYASVEADAAQTLVNAVNAPAEAVLGHSLIGSGAGGGAARGIAAAVGGAVSNALGPLEGTVLGSNFLGGAGLLGSQTGALLSPPTGGLSALTAARALLAPAAMTNAAAAPAAFLGGAIGNAIENAYLAIEPWVQYGFNLAAWAVGYLPWIGWLAPQINYFYYLFEPIVQSALFNTIDWLQRTITFTEALGNFWSVTTASINQFINTEINWVLSFLPPLPPVPPPFP